VWGKQFEYHKDYIHLISIPISTFYMLKYLIDYVKDALDILY